VGGSGVLGVSKQPRVVGSSVTCELRRPAVPISGSAVVAVVKGLVSSAITLLLLRTRELSAVCQRKERDTGQKYNGGPTLTIASPTRST